MLNLNKVNSYLIQKYHSGGKSNVKQTLYKSNQATKKLGSCEIIAKINILLA